MTLEKQIDSGSLTRRAMSIVSVSTDAASLALRAAAVLAKGAVTAPEGHDRARDAAQTIYEQAAMAAAARKEKKKRQDEIEAILVILLLAGEDAYQKTYNLLGFDGLKSQDEIQIGEQAKTFADARQPILTDYAGKLADTLKKANEEADEDGLSKVETARLLREAASGVSQTMALTEAQVTYGSVQIDRLARSGFKTKVWQTMEDEKVRPTHVECGEQGAIALDKPFSNGLGFPGDPNGSAAETINCRCYLIGGAR